MVCIFIEENAGKSGDCYAHHQKRIEVERMTILGIETSCDETSLSLLVDDKVKVNLISSQTIHNEFGGVIPELSSRAHLQQIIPMLKSLLNEAEIDLDAIDVISATAGPGLVGALLVGLTFGKSLALAADKPFVPVNHIEGHIFSGFLMEEKPEFPFLCSVVSGGHTLLLLVNNYFEIIQLGTTNDDAIGEAFDKVSKMIGFGYPGGPQIEKYSKFSDPCTFNFPIGKGKTKYDFSYSGLKTAVLRVVQDIERSNELTEEVKSNIAASFQKAAVDAIMNRMEMALKEFQVNSISLVGGVAANAMLRNRVIELGKKENKNVVIPAIEYCGDNAAMIALRGKHIYENGKTKGLNANVFPNLDQNAFVHLN